MTIFAIVDAGGKIVNRVELEEGAEWAPPEGFVMVPEPPAMHVGGTYLDGIYTPPTYPPPPPAPEYPPTSIEITLFDHENRIRAQEGEPPLSPQDFADKVLGKK